MQKIVETLQLKYNFSTKNQIPFLTPYSNFLTPYSILLTPYSNLLKPCFNFFFLRFNLLKQGFIFFTLFSGNNIVHKKILETS